MAQKIPFFELFTDFSPDFDLRVPLNAAMVTNMVLEPEKRTMTLDMTVRAEMNDSTRETVEQRRKSASSCTYIPVCPTWTR